ncbi:MAG TPA: ectonucleotide pyrophosphatase/phosphodiesterase [Vicinamibacterales bacterium]|jgi:predicted AlkP superfamily pyrophosphatase or phosphodiesterase|nr:ectonucleotide pyrophosphatase/phosphodiesterase [Vicinamibacterales bacterium]
MRAMRPPDRRPFVLLVVLVVLCAALGAIAQQPPASTGNHVVIITLDGFPGWALDDPYLPVPNLRRLAANGAVAGMRPVNPTVTWPNHTSLVTGVTPAKHGVLFNGTLVRDPDVPPRVEPWRDKKDMVQVPTLYDVVHDRGMTAAQVDWVAILNAPSISWEFPERPERPETKPSIVREMVTAGAISQQDADGFASQNIVWRDEVWTDAAIHILRTHRPNLLLFHLLALDSMQHRYGPKTPAAMVTMARLDSQVGRVLNALDDAGMTARTTLFVVSDHGFKAVQKQVLPNVALRDAGLITVESGKVTATKAYVVSEGGSAFMYVTSADPDGDLLRRARQAISGLEGIDRIVEPAEYGALGLPQPSSDRQVGALLLTAKSGYSFAAGATGEKTVVDAPEGSLGTHGYVSSDPEIQALFIASGRGIKSAVKLQSVDNVDVTPTAAELLGVELKNVDGKVLTEILR